MAAGYLEYGFQTNLFRDGTTRLVAPLAYGPNAGDRHYFIVDNGFVQATHLVCKKSTRGQDLGTAVATTDDDVALNYVVRLGANNTTASAAPLKATGRMRLTHSEWTAGGNAKSADSGLFVDATAKDQWKSLSMIVAQGEMIPTGLYITMPESDRELLRGRELRLAKDEQPGVSAFRYELISSRNADMTDFEVIGTKSYYEEPRFQHELTNMEEPVRYFKILRVYTFSGQGE